MAYNSDQELDLLLNEQQQPKKQPDSYEQRMNALDEMLKGAEGSRAEAIDKAVKMSKFYNNIMPQPMMSLNNAVQGTSPRFNREAVINSAIDPYKMEAQGTQQNYQNVLERYKLISDAERMKKLSDIENIKAKIEGQKLSKQGKESGLQEWKAQTALVQDSAQALKEPTQRMRDVETAYQKITRSADPSKVWKTGAGEVASLYNFIKMLDPGSTVREGEVTLTSNASPILQQVANLNNRFSKGQKIPQEVKSEMIELAKQAYTEEATVYNKLRDQHVNYLTKAGINPTLVQNAPFYKTLELSNKPNIQNTPIAKSNGKFNIIKEAGASEIKVINGKQYKKVQGGWEEVE